MDIGLCKWKYMMSAPQHVAPTVANEIRIYAVDFTATQSHHVTAQGFGYSTPLAAPLKSTSFRWEGRLHQPHPDSGYVSSSNGCDSLAALATNFAEPYRKHQNPVLEGRKEASYRFVFQPPSDFDGTRYADAATARPLTQSEQEIFIRAFQAANARA